MNDDPNVSDPNGPDPHQRDELDRELRAALGAEADRAQPDPSAWEAVQGRLGRPGWHRHPWRWAVLGVAAAAVVALGVVALAWPDDDEVVTTDSTAATAPVTTAATAPVVVTPPETVPTTAGTAPLPPTSTATTTTVFTGTRPTTAGAVTGDGRLVVLDVSGDAAVEVRELARGGDPREEPVEGDISVLGAPVISSDGTTVYYHSCCEPVVGTLFRAALDGSSAPEQIGYGAYPSLDPAGERLAFIRLGEIVVRDLATGAETTYPDPEHEGLMVDTAWSEDGTAVFYVRQDADTSQLVRLDLGSGAVEVVRSSSAGLRFPADAGGLTVVEQCCLYQTESIGGAAILAISQPPQAVPELPGPLDDRRVHGSWQLLVDDTGALTWLGPDGSGALASGYLAAVW